MLRFQIYPDYCGRGLSQWRLFAPQFEICPRLNHLRNLRKLRKFAKLRKTPEWNPQKGLTRTANFAKITRVCDFFFNFRNFRRIRSFLRALLRDLSPRTTLVQHACRSKNVNVILFLFLKKKKKTQRGLRILRKLQILLSLLLSETIAKP